MTKFKNSPDLFNDEPSTPSQDFASLFEQSLSKTNQVLRVGDSFRSEILSIGPSEAFVATPTTQDAVILCADLMNEQNQLQFKVGDPIDVVVIRVKGEEVRVTRKGSKAAPVDVESLEDAFDMELPVEGKVLEVVNGGYRISVQGQIAFCPISQLGVPQGQEPASYIGRKFEFLITQIDARKKNIVVSRRKLLDLKRAESEGLWLQTHKVGDIVEGRVTRIESFGAFVSIGESGPEGLVHISEIGFTRLKHAADGVRQGDVVRVKILKVDDDGDRLKISLSIKQAGGATDPWMNVPQSFPVGAIVEGTVEKKQAFGLFIELGPGITGLLPKSKWRDSDEAKVFEQAKSGDRVRVKVDEIKFEDRKISLGLPTEQEDDSWRSHLSHQSMGGAFAAALAKAQIKK